MIAAAGAWRRVRGAVVTRDGCGVIPPRSCAHHVHLTSPHVLSMCSFMITPRMCCAFGIATTLTLRASPLRARPVAGLFGFCDGLAKGRRWWLEPPRPPLGWPTSTSSSLSSGRRRRARPGKRVLLHQLMQLNLNRDFGASGALERQYHLFSCSQSFHMVT